MCIELFTYLLTYLLSYLWSRNSINCIWTPSPPHYWCRRDVCGLCVHRWWLDFAVTNGAHKSQRVHVKSHTLISHAAESRKKYAPRLRCPPNRDDVKPALSTCPSIKSLTTEPTSGSRNLITSETEYYGIRSWPATFPPLYTQRWPFVQSHYKLCGPARQNPA